MADMEQRYSPDDEERRGRRHDDDYRRDRDRRHGRHRRKRSRSRSRERHGSERRRSRRHSRSRSRSRSRSNSRSRHRDSSRSRDASPQRRRSLDYGDQGDMSQRHYETGDQGYGDFQGHMRDERVRNSGGKRHEKDWRMKLTSIRDAHFNRSKQPPPFAAQNQFQNDGSFLEMFKKKMAAESPADSSLTPNSLVLASSSIPYNSDISLPPLTAVAVPKPLPSTSADQDLDGVPIKKTTLPVPVSVGRRRCAKPLKTGVVFKKQQQSDEDEGSQEKLDAWSRYLQEVQKYKKDNLVEEDNSRPLVK